MTTTVSLKDRYKEVRERISMAAARAGRGAERIILVAVTKHAEPEQIRELIRMGHIDFGENRVQQLLQRAAIIDEWLRRHRTMPNTPWPEPVCEEGDHLWGEAAAEPARQVPDSVRWHMIGHLQRNKVRKVVDICRLIHSVDSLRLAEEIQQVAAKRDRLVDILLQVNASGESSKSGCAVPAAMHLAEQIDTMVQVRVRGLMTMAPLSEDPNDARPTFARAREVFEEIRDAGIGAPHFNILSMGMSNDFEVAVEEGANVLRVGTAIFGESHAAQAESDEE